MNSYIHDYNLPKPTTDKLRLNSSVDGGWSIWSTWSRCSADCGTGHQWRVRSCDSPEPVGFGQGCVGLSSEFKNCNDEECRGMTS